MCSFFYKQPFYTKTDKFYDHCMGLKLCKVVVDAL